MADQGPSKDRPSYATGRGRAGRGAPVAPVISPRAEVASRLEGLGVGEGIREISGTGEGSPGRYSDEDRGSSSSSSGNGNGNGSKRRSPPGVMGTARVGRVRNEVVSTRPDGFNKSGTMGDAVSLLANYVNVQRKGGANWQLHKYHVVFEPDIPMEQKGMRKALIRPQLAALGANIFDGVNLYLVNLLSSEASTFKITDRRDNQEYVIKIQLTEILSPLDQMYMTSYNIVVKAIQEKLGLTLMGRDYFDHTKSVRVDVAGLNIWPGFRTSLRQHEPGLMLCIDTASKVIRQETVLQTMHTIRNECHQNMDWRKAVEGQIVGTVVMTSYNRQTYAVDGILWNENPDSTFDVKGQPVTYRDYYEKKYKLQIRSNTQPLLISNPKKKDQRRGITQPFKLVPELCQCTGLTDAIRSNFQVMKSLSEHLFMDPQKRMTSIDGLVRSITDNTEVTNDLLGWNLRITNPQLVNVRGRKFANERIKLGQNVEESTDAKADFTNVFRNQRMLRSVALRNWVVFVGNRDANNIDSFLGTLNRNAQKMGFDISRPNIIRMNRNDPGAYDEEIGRYLQRQGKDLQMVFAVLPNNRKEVYGAVKKMTYLQFGIASQCFVGKNLASKGVMSISTKVAIQMNAKLGGEPWGLKVPLNNTMICGFDVHKGAMMKGKTVGALVATLNKDCTRYYSTTTMHSYVEELSQNIANRMKECLLAFHQANDKLPERVFFYRDGVGEGEFRYVYEQELKLIKEKISEVYSSARTEPPKLTFLILTKRINTRFFKMRGREATNPEPGTVVDDVVTLPERYDFFIVAQCVRQGTVSPTSYNVLCDESSLGPDKIQLLTYKLCHGYFNWSGTVAVPAPVQYAHKLAMLTGTALGDSAKSELSNSLYYL